MKRMPDSALRRGLLHCGTSTSVTVKPFVRRATLYRYAALPTSISNPRRMQLLLLGRAPCFQCIISPHTTILRLRNFIHIHRTFPYLRANSSSIIRPYTINITTMNKPSHHLNKSLGTVISRRCTGRRMHNPYPIALSTLHYFTIIITALLNMYNTSTDRHTLRLRFIRLGRTRTRLRILRTAG